MDYCTINSLWLATKLETIFEIEDINNTYIIYKFAGTLKPMQIRKDIFEHYYEDGIIQLLFTKKTRMVELLYL